MSTPKPTSTKFKCKHCDWSSEIKRYTQNHERTHDKSRVCPVANCVYRTPSASNLDRDMTSKHPKKTSARPIRRIRVGQKNHTPPAPADAAATGGGSVVTAMATATATTTQAE